LANGRTYEEGEREGKGEGRGCVFIAKFGRLFYAGILVIFHMKLYYLSLPSLKLWLLLLLCPVSVALYQ
jgi:hypothetical protein